MAVRLKSVLLNLLLLGVAVAGPFVAYAGVQAIYPGSAHTVNIQQTPPIKFIGGYDLTQATNAGFVSASSFNGSTNNYAASFTITVKGLAGGNVTIDKLVNVTCTICGGTTSGKVKSYRLEVSTGWAAGTTTAPTTLKYRLWGGPTPPTTDGIALSNSGPLNLLSNPGTCTGASGLGNCTAKANDSRWLQLLIVYPTGASSGTDGTVSIRPGDIQFY